MKLIPLATIAVLTGIGSTLFAQDQTVNGNLAVSGSAVNAPAAPTGAAGSQTFVGSGGGYWDGDGTHFVRVYAYKLVNGAKIFSPTYTQSNYIGYGGGEDNARNFNITWSWTAATGADGYRVYRAGWGGPADFTSFQDVTSTTLLDAGDAGWSPGSISTLTFQVAAQVNGGVSAAVVDVGVGYKIAGAFVFTMDSDSIDIGNNSPMTGVSNIFLGQGAGNGNSTGYSNTFIGEAAGYFNSTGNRNDFIGQGAGYNNRTGTNNNFAGYFAGFCNTTGWGNSYIGDSAGQYNTTGYQNTYVGDNSGLSSTTGFYNSFVGAGSGAANATGSGNSAIGLYAGGANINGSYNVSLGYYAGFRDDNGNQTSAGLSNTAAIGSYAQVTRSNAMVLGGVGPYAVNVGIGTTNPSTQLDVRSSSASSTGYMNLGNSDLSKYLAFYNGASGDNMAMYWTTGNDLRFGIANSGGAQGGGFAERMRITSAGIVGIGTSSPDPSSKLTVNGRVHAKEVVVDTSISATDLRIQPSAWADDVFDSDHQVAPLSEVEQEIKAHKHLPGIPSAAEVAANGVNVGDMQARLLAKIEELTLHQIEQEKLLHAQATQLQAQSARLSALEQENAGLRTR